jgi:hypothetical protein
MPEEDNSELELKVIEPSRSSSNSNVNPVEVQQFGKGSVEPNSAHLPLWKNGYINFTPENSVAMFALLALGIVSVLCIILGMIAVFSSNSIWSDKIFTALGSAITTIVGAIIGASVAGRKNRK